VFFSSPLFLVVGTGGFLLVLLVLVSFFLAFLQVILLFLKLLKLILDISVVEKIDELVPILVVAELTTENLNLTGEEPVDHGDRLGCPVAAWDGDINVLKGRITVTKGDAGDIHVRSFHDGLSVTAGIGDDQ